MAESLEQGWQRLAGLPAPRRECRAVVVIPARDEAEQIVAGLAALANQVDSCGRPLDCSAFEVLVFANNCRDATADLVRRFARSTSMQVHLAEAAIPPEIAHVGTARKRLMDEAMFRLEQVGRPRGVIASTDADTRVGRHWLARTWADIDRGADAVGGLIATDRAGRTALGVAARRAYLLDECYRRLLVELESRLDPEPHDPWPRHDHHFGASLAVTAEAYRRAGGLPPRQSLEDVALVEALRGIDARLRHSPQVRVTTSTRMLGRTSAGLAPTFRAWSESGKPQPVEIPDAIAAHFRERRDLRRGWLAELQSVPPEALPQHPTFGRISRSWTIERGEGRTLPTIDVERAIPLLREILRGLRSQDREPRVQAFSKTSMR